MSYFVTRLDGKLRKGKDVESPMKKVVYQRGVPDYDYHIGNLRFIRVPKKEEGKGKEIEEVTGFAAFSGTGQSLRQTKFFK